MKKVYVFFGLIVFAFSIISSNLPYDQVRIKDVKARLERYPSFFLDVSREASREVRLRILRQRYGLEFAELNNAARAAKNLKSIYSRYVTTFGSFAPDIKESAGVDLHMRAFRSSQIMLINELKGRGLGKFSEPSDGDIRSEMSSPDFRENHEMIGLAFNQRVLDEEIAKNPDIFLSEKTSSGCSIM